MQEARCLATGFLGETKISIKRRFKCCEHKVKCEIEDLEAVDMWNLPYKEAYLTGADWQWLAVNNDSFEIEQH